MNRICHHYLVFGVLFLLVFPFFFFSSCGEGKDTCVLTNQADSLNKVSFENQYKDLTVSSEAAEKAFQLKSSDPTVWAQTLNNMGFCAFMRMDFENAIEYFKSVLQSSNNEIECLVSDVGMMKICQRTSLNKEFFDYRNQALRRMKRISSDNTVMSDSEISKRYNYALSEFYIVSGIYYYYLQQNKESLESIEAIPVHTLEGDTAQWLYYMYMRGSGGMYEATTPEKIVLGEFGFLLDCVEMAHKHGYTYFEANSLQAMAELLNFKSNRDLLVGQRLGWMRMLNPEELPVDSLPLVLANRALDLFKQYGDWYQISGTYRTIATYYNYIGKPELALPNLRQALEYVNMHHTQFYHCTDSLDRLFDYREDIPYSVELKWVNDEGIKTVPEWVARLREQLSRTYSAMGMKRESDYNRNMYLDILDYTRQDKELESRYAALESELRQLNLVLSLVGVSTIVLIVLFFCLNRFWKRRYAFYLDELRMVLDLCRKITAAVPSQVMDKEEVSDVICNAVGKELLTLTRTEDMWIEWPADPDEEDTFEKPEWIDESGVSFELIAPGKESSVATLWLKKVKMVSKEECSLLKLILPYLAWTLENGLNLASLSDERVRLEKEQYIHLQHLIENKRQNVVKKSCLAVVTGIVPYIDRVVNEIHKLQSAVYARNNEIKRGKLVYISELLAKVNEHNDILAQWIKMRKGALNLNIENFELDELFRMIAKGRRSFDLKHQHLEVCETDAIVKADKALTLFMINTLTENARKYTPEGGRVEVYAQETETYVEVSVKDNGPGLSEKDVHRILSEKVYDSGSIGIETAVDATQLQKQKGHGFGLMNCKGIIDKYKKTNTLFSVCTFSIESELGHGSRFYFRLPKGIRRVVTILLLPLFIVMGFGLTSCKHTVPQIVQFEEEQQHTVVSYDSLLAIANEYANKVYQKNVDGQYEQALVLADSVLFYMNAHYMKYASDPSPLLVMYGKDEAAELTWFANDFDTDYFILLDVRNEIAVASLAVKNFEQYYYNNTAYTTLYKQVSEDNSLEEYCVQMKRSSNNKMIALTLFCIIMLGCLVAYYLLYWRRRLHYRYNLEQVFSINRAAFSVAGFTGKESSEVSMELVQGIFDEMNELVPIDNLVLAIKEEDADELRYSCFQPVDNEIIFERIRWCFDRQENVGDGDSMWHFLPLCVNAGGANHRVGVLALNWAQPSLHEEDKLLVKLIASYLAVFLYNAIVQVERKFLDIELAQDEARRALFEENMLHVQNLVLDNCLSTIKHETIYYPSRIRQIAERLLASADEHSEDEDMKLADMSELVSYYKDIFTLLASCASRQLDEVTFRRSAVPASCLVTAVQKYYKKSIRKRSVYPELEIEASDVSMIGDKILLEFMLENLVNEALQHEIPGKIQLKIFADQSFVRFDFTDMRRSYPQEELNTFFYPDHVQIDETGRTEALKGTEYLICKQIIREHDEFSGRRGCRINACQTSDGQGFTVWFTIPIQVTR